MKDRYSTITAGFLTSILIVAYVLFGACGVGSQADNLIIAEAIGTPEPTPRLFDIRKWKASSYLGLKLGTSTDADVYALLGQPYDRYSNRAEDKVFTKDRENELLLDYRNPAGVVGNVVIIIGKQTRLVKAISIYPTERLLLQSAIAKFGDKFFQKGNVNICVDEKEMPGVLDTTMSVPFILVYPNDGLLIDIRKDGDDLFVGRIDYLLTCDG